MIIVSATEFQFRNLESFIKYESYAPKSPTPFQPICDWLTQYDMDDPRRLTCAVKIGFDIEPVEKDGAENPTIEKNQEENPTTKVDEKIDDIEPSPQHWILIRGAVPNDPTHSDFTDFIHPSKNIVVTSSTIHEIGEYIPFSVQLEPDTLERLFFTISGNLELESTSTIKYTITQFSVDPILVYTKNYYKLLYFNNPVAVQKLCSIHPKDIDDLFMDDVFLERVESSRFDLPWYSKTILQWPSHCYEIQNEKIVKIIDPFAAPEPKKQIHSSVVFRLEEDEDEFIGEEKKENDINTETLAYIYSVFSKPIPIHTLDNPMFQDGYTKFARQWIEKVDEWIEKQKEKEK